MEYNAVGDSNVAVGYYALRGAAVGSNQVSNVALGSYAGLKNNTGTNNVFIGNRSGYNNSSGGNNVFFGFISGYNNTTGATNLFFGNSSGYSNKAASNNIFLGYQSGYNNDATGVGTGSNNLFMGDSTGYSNQTGNNNIFLGNSAGFTNDVAGTGAAVSNVFIGNKAGYYNTTGNSNVFLGTNAGIHNTTGIWNVYEGFLAGANNTTGAGNVCIGLEAGMGSAIQNNGGANVMIGYLAGAKNSGSFNAFTGYSAGFNNTSGAYNTFSGFDAGFNNTTAGYNTFSGYEAGLHNDLGQFNTFIGATAGYTTNSSTAVSNTFVGHSAGYYNTTAGYNTFLGYQSGFNTSTAGYNTFLGYKSGITNTTGTLNAALGQDADFAANNLTNATAIGANAYVGESNAIVLGSMAFVNGSVNDTYVGIGTTTPKNLLTVGPSPTAAAYSSEMFQIARTSDAYMAVRDGTATTVLGTTSGLAFVGTQSNTDFKLVTNNGEKVRITAAGNVGIGTTIPAAVLSVSNTSGSQLTGSSASTTFTTYSGSLGTTLGNTLKLASVGFYSANQSSLGIKAYRTASGTDWTTTAIGLEMDVDATDAVNTASLWLNANGNVGIGTAAPTQAKLVVFGSTNSYLAYAYYNSTGSPGSGGSGTQPFSIYANNRIAAVEFDAFSDARIKRVLGITNNSDDLNTLMKIKVTNYKYIDTIGRGTKLNKKVIAQELEKVYPNAVNQHIDVVPDIYHIADICDGKITVKNNLKECERVKLIFDDRTEIVEVEKADSTGFEVNLKDISATLNASERVFVYGREVNDFRTVDYEALSTLNISATQQLAKENEELKKQVTEQNKSIEQLKEEVKTIQALLNNNSWLLKPSIINNVSVEKK